MLALPETRPLATDELLAWLGEAGAPILDASTANEAYILHHPRTCFLKTLPKDAVICDVGAGAGMLPVFRRWPGLLREDLRFVGVSLFRPEKDDEYDDFIVGDIDAELPDFTLRPTAAVLAHFIEHINDRPRFFRWLAEQIPAGGRIYIEWPSLHSQHAPRLADIKAQGYELMTINFFDDSTHVQPIAPETIVKELGEAGFTVRSGGFVDMPFLADRLRDCGVAMTDSYLLTIGVWLKTLFGTYFMASRDLA